MKCVKCDTEMFVCDLVSYKEDYDEKSIVGAYTKYDFKYRCPKCFEVQRFD